MCLHSLLRYIMLFLSLSVINLKDMWCDEKQSVILIISNSSRVGGTPPPHSIRTLHQSAAVKTHMYTWLWTYTTLFQAYTHTHSHTQHTLAAHMHTDIYCSWVWIVGYFFRKEITCPLIYCQKVTFAVLIGTAVLWNTWMGLRKAHRL